MLGGVALDGETVYLLEDRPDGLAVLLTYWKGPRVVRLLEDGRTQLVMAIDFELPFFVLGSGALLTVVAICWLP